MGYNPSVTMYMNDSIWHQRWICQVDGTEIQLPDQNNAAYQERVRKEAGYGDRDSEGHNS